jgi:hypothetical protein
LFEVAVILAHDLTLTFTRFDALLQDAERLDDAVDDTSGRAAQPGT